MLRRAAALDLRATTLDLRNSGDTAGDRSRVVGYGAYAFEYAANAHLTDAHRGRLRDAARTALSEAAGHGRLTPVTLNDYPLPLRAIRKTFVTLEIEGELRGCIGSVATVNPLVVDVVQNTFKSAMQDPRFGPLTVDEVPRIEITISILSHPRPLQFTNEADLVERLRPEVDGLILRDGGHQALFLPKVWHQLPQARQFLRHLKAKAGLNPDHESGTLRAFRFSAETF
ncbi:conserved hypothetical protein [uncultured Gammaproteobacteria bacterium]